MGNTTRTVVLRRGEGDREERLRLAVNPRDLVISQPQNTLKYVTVSGETVHTARGRGLTEVTLETFFPAEGSPFFQEMTPREGIALLRRWETGGSPVRLTISGTETDGLFLITRLRQTLSEGDEDVGVSIELREYRYLSAGEETLTGAGGLALREEERDVPAVHVTAAGEDLWTIARRYYGDGSRWRDIALRNGICDPHELPGGKELWLA